jgi:hypothetical protein
VESRRARKSEELRVISALAPPPLSDRVPTPLKTSKRLPTPTPLRAPPKTSERLLTRTPPKSPPKTGERVPTPTPLLSDNEKSLISTRREFVSPKKKKKKSRFQRIIENDDGDDSDSDFAFGDRHGSPQMARKQPRRSAKYKDE